MGIGKNLNQAYCLAPQLILQLLQGCYMLHGYKIIDADSHVIEPVQMWAKYLAPEFKHFAPSADMKIQGEDITQKISQQVRDEGNRQMMEAHPHAYFHRYDVESHLQAMVKMGVDLAFVYPTYGLWLFAIDSMPKEVVGAFTHAYNTWLYEEFCSYAPDKLKGVGAINLHAPEQMVTELYRIAEFGWKAVFLRPNPVKGRLLSDTAYEPFWTNAFEGSISDVQRSQGNYLICYIPYPPRPIIAHDECDKTAPLNTKDLTDWIESPSNEPPYCSPNPYIPTTCT